MKRSTRVVLGLMLLGVSTSALSGCYRRVISAKGIGADASYPERSQSSESKIDKAIDRALEGKDK